MTIEQEKAIRNAKRLIQSARYALDAAMYGDIEHPMLDKEFKKLRESYDYVCKAYNVLP